ncbi:MAG: hypothetical protein ABEI52_02880 [Halobacteriaceae archaeon]
MNVRSQLAAALLAGAGVTAVVVTLFFSVEIVEPFYAALGPSGGGIDIRALLDVLGGLVLLSVAALGAWRIVGPIRINVGSEVTRR